MNFTLSTESSSTPTVPALMVAVPVAVFGIGAPGSLTSVERDGDIKTVNSPSASRQITESVPSKKYARYCDNFRTGLPLMSKMPSPNAGFDGLSTNRTIVIDSFVTTLYLPLPICDSMTRVATVPVLHHRRRFPATEPDLADIQRFFIGLPIFVFSSMASGRHIWLTRRDIRAPYLAVDIDMLLRYRYTMRVIGCNGDFMKKLFIDDERYPSGDLDDWCIVRNYEEAVEYLRENGCPKFISFDHDLGIGKNGHDVAKWIVEADLDSSGFIPVDFEFYVHSQNPIGGSNINGYLTSYFKSVANLVNGEE